MWVDTILFAARHHTSHDDGAGVILGLIVVVVLFVVFVMRIATAQYDLIQRNGLPYCPRWNRQVSLRREFCRACGYRFVTYGSSPAERREPKSAPINHERSLRARKHHLAEEEARRREEERRRVEQEAEKRDALTVLNIQVSDGPPPIPKPKVSLMDRFRALPDIAQAAVIGPAIAIPAVVVLVLAFGLRKADPPAPPDLVLPAGTPTLPADATVYMTRRGTRYHKEACTQLLGMGVPVVFREAVRELVPCRECWLEPAPPAIPPSDRPKADPEKHEPVLTQAAGPKSEENKHPTPVVPQAMVAPAGPASVAASPPPVVAAGTPPPIVVAAPAAPISVPAIRSPKRTYRSTAKVEYRMPDPWPRGQETAYGTTPTGIPTHMGPRGGIYHYSPSGRKVYESSRHRR
jgi:hypothetical protein